MSCTKRPPESGSSLGEFYHGQVAIVVIGRNEGESLNRSLQSAIDAVRGVTDQVIYVDSGSTDGSPQFAERMGVKLLQLNPAYPFTAARARNEGFATICALRPALQFVQFLDGDSELATGWCEIAMKYLSQHQEVAVVWGRLRERCPEMSVYNQLCDAEWDGPVGQSESCGGIAMMRARTLAAAGCFRSDLQGGEEPELCIRLRAKGYKIVRIASEMARHDANMTRFAQWWARGVRNGAGFVEVPRLHKHSPFIIWQRERARAIAWGGVLPALIGLGAFIHPIVVLLLLAYPAQVIRVAAKRGASRRFSWWYGLMMTVGKFAEFQGIIVFLLRDWRARHNVSGILRRTN